jgi:hypothetical protein
MAGVGCSSEELKGRTHARLACQLQRRISGHSGKATGGHAVLVNKWNGNLREEIVGTEHQRLCGQSAPGRYASRRKTESESCTHYYQPWGSCTANCLAVHDNIHRGGHGWPHSSRKKCPHALLCREKLLEAVEVGGHNANTQQLVDAVSSLRWDQDLLSDSERNSHLMQAMTSDAFHVFGVQVCMSTFCWAHGHTRHRVAKAGTGQGPSSDRRASMSGRSCK